MVGVNLGYDGIEEEDDEVSLWCTECENIWEHYINFLWNIKTLLGKFVPLPTYFGDNPVWAIYWKASEILGYNDQKELMKKLNCSEMYTVEFLSVSRSARGKGIGTRLVIEGEKEAKERGAQCGRVFTTSKYSAKIFSNLGWSEMARLKYEDFKDAQGNRILNDTGDHDVMVTYNKQL